MLMATFRGPKQFPFSSRPLPTKVVISYIFDYVIIVILAIGFLALDKVNGFRQHFALSNYTLQYPYAVHERVPAGWCYVIAVMCPALIIAFWTLVIDGLFSHSQPTADEGAGRRLGRYRLKDRLWELNCGILGLALSEGVAFVITGTFKNAVGKPRPDVIDRCQPAIGSVDPSPYGLSNSTICTQTDSAILKDGFRSFPSGHSSSSFAGLFYLSLYLAAKLHVWDSRGEVWKIFVVVIPSIGAGLIAASRIMDARHHPFDVITGSLLGIACAYAAYRQYFPAVSDTKRKGRAYPIRSWGGMSQQAEGASTAYQGIESGQNVAVQAAQRRPTHSRNGPSESHAPLAAAPAPFASTSTGRPHGHASGRDEWEQSSSADDDDFEMHSSYPTPGAATSGVGVGDETAYIPRAHLTSSAAEHV